MSPLILITGNRSLSAIKSSNVGQDSISNKDLYRGHWYRIPSAMKSSNAGQESIRDKDLHWGAQLKKYISNKVLQCRAGVHQQQRPLKGAMV